MKHYDFAKARRIIDNLQDQLEEASMGMYEDWWWTAKTVFEDGKYIIELYRGEDVVEDEKKAYELYKTLREAAKNMDERLIALQVAHEENNVMCLGIAGSRWATPALRLDYKDGRSEMIRCFIQTVEVDPVDEALKKAEAAAIFVSGPLSSEVTDRLPELQDEPS